MGSSDASTAEMVEYSTVEGLYLRGLKVDEAFSAELKKIGIDLARPEPRYPAKLWRASLDLAQTRYFGSMPRDTGRMALGEAAFSGFLSTLSGKFIAAALTTLVTPPSLIKKLPRFFQMTRPGLVVTVQEESPRCWRGIWKDPSPDPYFTIGIIAAAGRKTASGFTASLDRVNPDGFELLFRWD